MRKDASKLLFWEFFLIFFSCNKEEKAILFTKTIWADVRKIFFQYPSVELAQNLKKKISRLDLKSKTIF